MTLFLDELARRNIEVKLDDEGNYTLDVCGLSIKGSLENVSSDFERDRDADRIVTFVDSIANSGHLDHAREPKTTIALVRAFLDKGESPSRPPGTT